MVSGGMQAVQLMIEHQGNPDERMPVVRIRMGESPAHTFPRQTRGDMRILVDIIIVVELNEIKMPRLPEDDPDGGHEQEDNGGDGPRRPLGPGGSGWFDRQRSGGGHAF